MRTISASIEHSSGIIDRLGQRSQEIDSIAQTIREIALATGEQREATGEIAHTIESIARTSETDAIAVDEAGTAARNLRYLAADLKKAVSRFKTPNS